MSEPLILCDVCKEPASRLILRGAPSERRFFCEPHGDDSSVVFCLAKRENDAVRELPQRELVYRMRLQNYRRGLLSLGRFGALEKRDGPRPR